MGVGVGVSLPLGPVPLPSTPSPERHPSCRAGEMSRVLQETLQNQGPVRAETRQPDPPANTPGSSQAGTHRVATETHRHPRGERPAEQPPCRQHRGDQPSHLSLSPSPL